MKRFYAVLYLAVLAAPSPAGAVCPETVVENALSARVRGDQANAVLQEAVKLLPESIALPQDPVTLFQCPGFLDDTVLTPRNGSIVLDLRETEVWLESGTVSFRARFNLDVDVDLDLQMCALPDASCPAALDGESIELFARVRLGVLACEPEVSVETLEVNVVPENTQVNLGNCGLYDDVVNGVYGWLEGTLLGFVRDQLSGAVQRMAPQMVRETFDTVATQGVEALGFRLFVAPQAITVTPNEILLTLGAGVTPVVEPERCAPGGQAIRPPSLVSPLPPTSGGASVAVSRDFANYLVDVAWRRGWLCLDTRTLGLDLGAPLEALAPGVEVSALVFAPVRPSLRLGEVESGGRVGIDIPSLEVQVGIELPNAPPSLITIEGAAFAAAALEIDPVDGSVLLSPQELDTERLDVLTTSGPIVLDPDGLRGTVDNLVMPLFREQLSSLALTGGVFAAAGVVAELVELRSDSDAIGIALDLYGADFSDQVGPTTVLETAPPVSVRPSMTLTMASFDDTPPTRFVNHWVSIDGVMEDEPRTGRVLAFNGLTPGPHAIEIAAADLAGNIDETPERVFVEVDAQPPLLEIIDAPRGIARDSSLVIEHEVRDDFNAVGDIRVDYTIGEISLASEPDVIVARGSVEPGSDLVLDGLLEDRSYRVTLVATDQAGNEMERTVSFAVDREPTLDCSTTGTAPFWLALFMAAPFLLRRRRLFALTLCVGLGVANDAQAITTGGAFAGPTLESGTSSYWNAASLTQKRGATRFYFEGGGSLIDIGYTRTDLNGADAGFDTVRFGTLSPTFSFMLTTPTPLPELDILVGGYSPTTSGAGWPDDGPQRFFGTTQTLFTYAVPVGVLYSPAPWWGVSLMVGPSWGFVDTYTAFDFGNFANDQLPPGAEPFPRESSLLEGVTYISASGFGYAATAGVWAEPLKNLRVGLGGVYNGTVTMNGDLELQVPESIEESTGLALTPAGDIELTYRLPWAINTEVEYRLRNHRLAVTFDYQHKSRRDYTPANVTNSDPSFVDGPRLSVAAAINDWTIGVRDLWHVNQDWDVALRFDYDPRSVPDESLNPVNLDFTSFEAALGGRYRVTGGVSLSMTYAFRYLQPIEVTNSLFNPRMPGDSGLNLPSANGLYDPAPVHRIVLGVDWGGG